MRQVTVAAPAKINLSLDVTGRREDGYHLLSSVMQSIDLADHVSVTAGRELDGIRLSCGADGVPSDRRNTAWRAAELFLQSAGIRQGVAIAITKHIMTAAGLAGGSADAAAVLHALDLLFPETLSATALVGIAGQVGADVPFCLRGGTALCGGIGEILTPLRPFDGMPVLLCKPDFGISTAWVFKQLDIDNLGIRPDQEKVLDALSRRDLQLLARSSANVLESVSLPAFPVLAEIKEKLLASGAAFALMSGSGPTIFGLFRSFRERDTAWDDLSGAMPDHVRLIRSVTLASGPYTVYNGTAG